MRFSSLTLGFKRADFKIISGFSRPSSSTSGCKYSFSVATVSITKGELERGNALMMFSSSFFTNVNPSSSASEEDSFEESTSSHSTTPADWSKCSLASKC